MIVALGDPAVRLVLSWRDQPWPDPPVAFAVADEAVARAARETGRATGVVVCFDVEGGLRAALALLPDTEEVVLVAGGDPFLPLAERALQALGGRVRVTRLVDVSLAEARRGLAELPPRSFVYYTQINLDRDGRGFFGRRALEELAPVSRRPIFRGAGDGRRGRPGPRRDAALGDPRRGEPVEPAPVRLAGSAPVRPRRESSPPGKRGALRQLSGRILTAQEEERSRIARELHDGVSQQVALFAIELDQLGAQPDRGAGEAPARARVLAERARELSRELHHIAHELHPAILDQLGLVPALRQFANQLSARQGLKVEVAESEWPPDLPADVSLALYRVAQEALQNVSKHSGAAEARVALRGSP
ncbi:MAG TPA: histidine kinase, partial [Vicinamibacteria bacterium]|nr:histidine kinase [Vicinamibacteria bacterium]